MQHQAAWRVSTGVDGFRRTDSSVDRCSRSVLRDADGPPRRETGRPGKRGLCWVTGVLAQPSAVRCGVQHPLCVPRPFSVSLVVGDDEVVAARGVNDGEDGFGDCVLVL